MHEHGLIRDLLSQIKTVATDNGVDRVAGVTVRLGALTAISADHFREHFVEATHEGIAAHAKLTVIEDQNILDPRAHEIVLDAVEIEA